MFEAGPRADDRTMNKNKTKNKTPDQNPLPPPPLSETRKRRLTRSSDDKMIGGVAGGLGRHLDVIDIIRSLRHKLACRPCRHRFPHQFSTRIHFRVGLCDNKPFPLERGKKFHFIENSAFSYFAKRRLNKSKFIDSGIRRQ